MPHQPSQIDLQGGRILGRDAVPGLEPGVVDTLLRVEGVLQDAHGNTRHVCAVLDRGLLDGILVAGEIQGDDVLIFHNIPSFRVNSRSLARGPSTYITDVRRGILQILGKIIEKSGIDNWNTLWYNRRGDKCLSFVGIGNGSRRSADLEKGNGGGCFLCE